MINKKHDLKKLSSIDKNKLAILVEKYGADQLLNEGFDKKKLAALIGAGIITGSSLMDLPKNYTNKEDTRIEYNNPYGVNNIDYKNILNKEKLVKEYISNILSKHGKTLSDLRFNTDNLVLASYQYDYDLPLLLAQLQMESHFGTTKRAQRTNSMFSIGAYDDGRDVVKYADQDSSIIPFIKIIKRDYLMNGKKDIDQLLQNFVNHNGNRYASNPKYERDLVKIRNSIISKYPELLNDYYMFRFKK